MPNSRVFVQTGSQAGVFHVVSRVVDRTFRLGEREKDEMVRLLKALAAFHQVEILTYCLMSNHFHLLVRVPEQPEGFDLPLDKTTGVTFCKGGDLLQGRRFCAFFASVP